MTNSAILLERPAEAKTNATFGQRRATSRKTGRIYGVASGARAERNEGNIGESESFRVSAGSQRRCRSHARSVINTVTHQCHCCHHSDSRHERNERGRTKNGRGARRVEWRVARLDFVKTTVACRATAFHRFSPLCFPAATTVVPWSGSWSDRGTPTRRVSVAAIATPEFHRDLDIENNIPPTRR